MSAIPTYEEALAKLQRYCAYQERCHSEVRTKLISIKCYGDQLEEVISALIQDDYLNELRFAKTYTSGKYRLKAWGRNKIIQALKKKNISEYCIRKGIESIDELDYMESLERALLKYQYKYDHLDHFTLRGKLFKYGINKGYTHSELNSVLDKLIIPN